MNYIFFDNAGEPVYSVIIGTHDEPDYELADWILGYIPGAVKFAVTDCWDHEDDPDTLKYMIKHAMGDF